MKIQRFLNVILLFIKVFLQAEYIYYILIFEKRIGILKIEDLKTRKPINKVL